MDRLFRRRRERRTAPSPAQSVVPDSALYRPVPPGRLVRCEIVRERVGLLDRVYHFGLEVPRGYDVRKESGEDWHMLEELRADQNARLRRAGRAQAAQGFYTFLLCVQARRWALGGAARRTVLEFASDHDVIDDCDWQRRTLGARQWPREIGNEDLSAPWVIPLFTAKSDARLLVMEAAPEAEALIGAHPSPVGQVVYSGLRVHGASKVAQVVCPLPNAPQDPPVLLADVKMGGSRRRWIRGYTTDALTLAQRGGGLRTFKASVPQWDFTINAYTLNFNGRAKKASDDNFRYFRTELPPETPDEMRTVLQLGLWERNTFKMDVGYPCSLVQAFGVALACGMTDSSAN